MSLPRKFEKTIDRMMRSLFSGGGDEPGAREAIELYREALDQIAGKSTIGKRGERIFPFNRVTIELEAGDAERKAAFEELFERVQLAEDIRAALREERVKEPEDLHVHVRFPETPLVELTVICERTGIAEETAVVRELVPARLTTITGVSSDAEFALDRPHINIGRERELTDALGRVLRRNDLFFDESADAANASVSRAHAHIVFDGASGDWRIFDDGSSFGTALFRQGKRIDVPAHAGRGVALREGDEIYLGQVRLRFEAAG